MAAPTVSSVTPASGLSMGGTYVEIAGAGFNDLASGGTVRVFFGGVASPEFGVVDATKIVAVTPGGDVGPVDVRVENVGPGGAPVEPTTLAAGYEYQRPVVATSPDHSTDDAVLVVTRRIVEEFRRCVLANTHHDMHPEYADAADAAVPQEHHAKAPAIKIVGPDIAEDRFYAVNGRVNVQTVESVPGVTVGEFEVRDQPVTVRLDYQYVVTGRTSGEAMNLWAAVTAFFERVPFVRVPLDGSDLANGSVDFEMSPVWEQRGEARKAATREGIYQITGAFVVRGVMTASPIVAKGADAAGIDIETTPANETTPV